MLSNYDEKTWFCDQVIENKLALFRLAKSILKNDADAEDAVQDAVLSAYSKLSTLRDRDKFKSWIMRILVNAAYQTYNKSKPEICVEDVGDIPATIPQDDIEALSLWSAVETLSDDLRAVVVLFYYEDMSISEISRITGVRRGAIKTRLCRARQKLKPILLEERSTQ